MAKRRNLKDTLRKERENKTEQEPVLAQKVALPKSTKDITKIAEQADTIHKKEVAPIKTKPSPTPAKKVETKAIKKEVAVPDVVVKERVTVWMPKSVLKTLKVHLAMEEKKITEYFTALVKKDLKIK